MTVQEYEKANTSEKGNQRFIRMHPYPATMTSKLSLSLIQKFSKKDDWVFDPFCGTGTVLRDARITGRNAFGRDINPISGLIARATTKSYTDINLNSVLESIMDNSQTDKIPFPKGFIEENRLDYWFESEVLGQIYALKDLIYKLKNKKVRDFFLVALSATVRRVSRADPEIAPPVISKKMRDEPKLYTNSDVLSNFHRISVRNIATANKLSSLYSKDNRAIVRVSDSINKISKSARQFDLMITSPPYIAAQKYIRTTSLELMIIFGLSRVDLRQLDNHDIGSERILVSEMQKYFTIEGLNRKEYRAQALVSRYVKNLTSFLSSNVLSMKPESHLALVIGENMVGGTRVPLAKIILKQASDLGLECVKHYVDTIKIKGKYSRCIKGAGSIKREHILVFKEAQ